eukprot:TRINITY_DN10833_c0_g1_i18.p2 TRINITY_DN10833_c0_g1~~TRINITY_DN10833_c0_g1_i18.p2  ORF type:complete len:213 (+),score=86.40 TRINITY_DN10833_c0_g1_i18:1022-1660(+)
MVCCDIDVFCSKFPLLEKNTSDFVEKMNAFIVEADGAVGIEIHKYFIEQLERKCHSKKHWEDIVANFEKVLRDTLPKELLSTDSIVTGPGGEKRLAFDEATVLSKALKHFNILNYVRTTMLSKAVALTSIKTLMALADAFKESASFAHEFNMDIELRTNLRKAGLRSQNSQLKNLVSQENEALLGYFELVFAMHKRFPSDKEHESLLRQMWK